MAYPRDRISTQRAAGQAGSCIQRSRSQPVLASPNIDYPIRVRPIVHALARFLEERNDHETRTVHIDIAAGLVGLATYGGCEMKLARETAHGYFRNTAEAILARAAAAGRTAEVMRLVEEGAKVNAVGEKNMTPLVWTLLARNIEGMRALLQAGADPNQNIGPEREFHPVWLAAGMDTPEPLRVLLQFKGNPNASHRGPEFNALMQSTMRLENLKLLVQAGADVNAVDAIGRTVALTAANLAQYDAVIYLLEHGYQCNLPSLARAVKGRLLSPDLDRRRQRVLEVLESKGVTPPAGKAPPIYG